MGNLTIDLSVMHAVSSQAGRAAAEFASERPLSTSDGGAFGADGVASAYTTVSAAQDAMVRSLGENARTLSGFADEAASTVHHVDAGLARSIQ